MKMKINLQGFLSLDFAHMIFCHSADAVEIFSKNQIVFLNDFKGVMFIHSPKKRFASKDETLFRVY